MPKLSLIEQLDEAVQAILSDRDAVPEVDASLAPLLRIVASLRDLPREEFKARLKQDLQRPEQDATPGGFLSVTPYLVFSDASRAIAFYKRAFGAVERFRLSEPSGKIAHAEIMIGGSVIKLSDEYPEYGLRSPGSIGGSPVRLHLYVKDVDAVAARAIEAGAKVVRPVQDQFYGDRSGHFADPFGYTWSVATHKEDVPPEEIQRRFREMLGQSGTAERKASPIPEGFRTITPYLVVNEAPELIEFVKQAFGAEEKFRTIGSAGGIHCEVKIGDSMVMIGGGANWRGTPKPTALHLYVPNADEVYERALKAGAVSTAKPVNQPYGDREAGVRDVGGNFWYIATHRDTGHAPAGLGTITPYLHPREPERMIDFLKRGFGAEELFRTQSPDGVIHHAKIRLGSSVLEMGEAHGPYQPMPTMFYLYVEDVDALYQQALQAGGTSISPPADQPYGDRNAGVRDPFDNEWYIATRVKEARV
ncbi:MAG TPA: VOC family protein [Terriglobales bacterium]|nr:VOC family protein [Terriglobales bacterium]